MGTASEARASLWARYDAGELGADELDARLRAVDRAGDDPQALERATTGPVRAARPGRRKAVLAGIGVVAVVAVGAGLLMWLGDDGAEAGGGGGTSPGPTGFEPIPLPEPEPGIIAPEPVDCPQLDQALEAVAASSLDEAPANPEPFSDPPALPEGYTVADEVELVPGSDPDLPMSIAAGTPLPVDVQARALLGPLTVTMRTFTYESVEAAAEAGLSVIDDAICSYGAEPFTVPDQPNLTGSVVSGIIPTTAFVNWRLGDRRFSVSVQAGADGDPDATTRAQEIAGEIAARELEAARTVP